MSAINVQGLLKAAQQYDKDLKVLPHLLLQPALAELRIRLMSVANKHTIIERLRKGGITRPYGQAQDIEYGELGELRERSLQTYSAYAAIKDHIMNYREKDVLFDPTKPLDNQGKKHPLELEIIKMQVETVGEDIIDALFPAARNLQDNSPLGMFDGIDTIITDAIEVSGEISKEEGNLVESGEFPAPLTESDTIAWDRLVDWVRKASVKFALGQTAVIRMPIKVYSACSDALANKLRYKDVLFEDFQRHLQDKTNFPKLLVVRHYALGSGDRVTLMVDGNIDMGMNIIGDEQFVQVRNPWEDPNLVQFWLQFDSGLRINSLHPYKFMVNEGTPVENLLSGDYIAGSGSGGLGV